MSSSSLPGSRTHRRCRRLSRADCPPTRSPCSAPRARSPARPGCRPLPAPLRRRGRSRECGSWVAADAAGAGAGLASAPWARARRRHRRAARAPGWSARPRPPRRRRRPPRHRLRRLRLRASCAASHRVSHAGSSSWPSPPPCSRGCRPRRSSSSASRAIRLDGNRLHNLGVILGLRLRCVLQVIRGDGLHESL